jgi:hypothetical protein
LVENSIAFLHYPMNPNVERLSLQSSKARANLVVVVCSCFVLQLAMPIIDITKQLTCVFFCNHSINGSYLPHWFNQPRYVILLLMLLDKNATCSVSRVVPRLGTLLQVCIIGIQPNLPSPQWKETCFSGILV